MNSGDPAGRRRTGGPVSMGSRDGKKLQLARAIVFRESAWRPVPVRFQLLSVIEKLAYI
jgi:hypothetical protein